MLGLLRRIRSFFKGNENHQRHVIDRPIDINSFDNIFIDPCFNICNLRCPYCPVGRGVKLKDMSRGMMSLDVFTRVWERSFADFRGTVSLYNWGESFLNPDLPGIVGHIRKNSRARLTLNSNFSFRFDDRILDILKHLEDDTIIISCDGFSQETCEKYRVNVDFKLVMHNIELIRVNKKPQTQLYWQYLKFPWSIEEVKAAEQYCKEKGIGFYPGEGGITPDFPVLPVPRAPDRKRLRCEFIFHSLSINFDGEIYPCCAYYGPQRYSLGNASQNSIQEIFSSGKGKETLDYLTLQSNGHDGIFCKHCVERNTDVLESWK
ncbi:MAG: radical SAM protein [Pirellulales bacterium]|nr:radical SAM protein [Pirellulales bacterium]